MTNREVYDIVEKGFKAVNEKLDHIIECKEDKIEANRKNGLIWKVMLSLFGINILSLITLFIMLKAF